MTPHRSACAAQLTTLSSAPFDFPLKSNVDPTAQAMAEAIAQSGVPQDFEGWVARPMPLNVEKCGERAAFWDNFCGAPSVVERANCDNKEDGCVVYGREPMGVDKAFRITLEGTTDRKWQRGLVSFVLLLRIGTLIYLCPA